MVTLRRADVWWSEEADEKPRPVLILTRDEAIPVLRKVLVAPVTSRVRGIPSELHLGSAEGLPRACAAIFDNAYTIPKVYLVRRVGSLGPERRHELCAALRAAVDC